MEHPLNAGRTLPEGWRWAKLGELCAWGSGGTPRRGNPDYYGGSIPWAIIADLNDGVVTKTEEHISLLGLENSSASIVPKDTLLVAMYGSIGKLGVSGIPMATNQAIAHALPHEGVDLWWLFYNLLSTREQLKQAGSGVTQKNISQKVLKKWEVALPPFEEQRRIVVELEEQLGTVDRVRLAAQVQLATIEALPNTILQRAFLADTR